jgi:ADP-ribose pyrophosphatase
MRLIRRRVVYRGRIIRLVRETLSAGGRRLVRETVQHPGSVVIVPLTSDGRVVFVRQYRRAVGRTLLELPAGTLDHDGESAARCARRELEEETGWQAREWTRLGRFYPAPGFLSEQMVIFLAEGLTRVPAHPEPDEIIEPVTLSFAQALAKIASGRICDAKSIIGILFAARRNLELRRKLR